MHYVDSVPSVLPVQSVQVRPCGCFCMTTKGIHDNDISTAAGRTVKLAADSLSYARCNRCTRTTESNGNPIPDWTEEC